MNSPLRIGILTLFVSAGLMGGDAMAQKAKYNPFTLVKSLKKEKKKSRSRGAKGPKIIREGGFKTIKNKTVLVSGGTTLKLSDIIQSNFGKAQKRAGARGAKSLKSRGLYIQPAIEEHATETKDNFVISRRTTYVVSDPKKHGFKGHRAKKGARGGRANKRVKKGQYALNKIPAKQRKFYKENILPNLPKLPKSHPLRKAYEKGGMAGFLNAFTDGKGDYSESNEVTIPKGTPEIINGRVRFPGTFMVKPKDKKGARGKTDRFATTKKIDWLTNISKSKAKGAISKPKKKYSYQEVGGELSYDHKFLTGWTWSKHWGKEHHKDYWLLEYKFWANIGFTIGFRVPVQFKGKMSPAYIKTVSNKKSGDKKGSFSVELSADVFDAPTSYYKSVGRIDKDPQSKGKEFPFHVYVSVGAFVEIFGKDVFDKSFGIDVNYSHDLKPVYGKDQVLEMKGPGEKKYKNAEFYIPSDLTQTVLRVPTKGGSIWAKVEGLIGAQIGGDGSVSAKVAPVINGKVGKGRTVSLSRGDKKTVGPFTVPKKSNFGTTKYGYKISDPKYKWTVEIRPAVKGVISGECDHWWCGYAGPSSYTLGPWYPLGWIKLGTIRLDRHAGTTSSYTVQDGKKDFIKEDIKGESFMYVCLKSSKGKYIHTSSDRLNLAFAQYKNCGLKSTFRVETTNASGKTSTAPMIHGRTVSLKSVFGRYLSIDKDGKFAANKTKVGKNELFKLSIQGAKKDQPLQIGDKISLHASDKTAKSKKRAIIAVNGGGGKIVGYKKGWKSSESIFTVVASKKKKFKWTCEDGKRDGHSNCSVTKMSALKALGNKCNRDGTKCPCYIEKEKNKNSKAKVWCLLKATLTVGKKKSTLLENKDVCWLSAPKRTKSQSIKLVATAPKIRIDKTYCQAGSFRTKLKSVGCKADDIKSSIRNLHGVKVDDLFFRQNTNGCPFWISSKYKQIATRAIPKAK